jgi:hypothetical protein
MDLLHVALEMVGPTKPLSALLTGKRPDAWTRGNSRYNSLIMVGLQ